MPVDIVDIDDAPTRTPPHEQLTGAFVLFCRYLSSRWLSAIESCAAEMAGVGLFLDDDIDALANDSAVPLLYRRRLRRLHLRHRARLNPHCDLVFVSNRALADRYASARPYVLQPIASDSDNPGPGTQREPFRIFFQSSFVHAAEHRWLRPIIGAALAAEPSASFEVIANPLMFLRWRRLARTQVVRPMPWPQYRATTRERGADLLLAPLLPTRANAARSWTKRIDAMRLGAALLVSDPDIYNPSPEEQSLGMCLPLDPEAWVKAICELVHDRNRLNRLRDLNRSHVLSTSEASNSSLSDVLARSL